MEEETKATRYPSVEEEIAAKKREEYCAGLEALAQYLRTNPEVVLPDTKEFLNCLYDKTSFVQAVKSLGHCEKEYTNWTVKVFKQFGPLKYGVYTSRETVCEKKVVGKKIVPFREAYLVQAEPEHEEDIVEWECHPILASDSTE